MQFTQAELFFQNLPYRTAFPIAGLFICAIMLLFSLFQRGSNQSEKEFRTIVYFSFSANALDVITTITLKYYEYIPRFLNMLLDSTLYLTTALLALSFARYVNIFIQRQTSHKLKNSWHLSIPIVIISVFFIINLFVPIIFWFDADGSYIKGSFYPIVMVVPLFYAAYILYLFIRYKNCMSVAHKNAIIFLITISVIGAALQFTILPTVLLLTFSTALSLIPVYLTMETPDYIALMETNDQLLQAKDQANAANQAKTDFLANMSHEIRTPINAVLGMNEMILRENKDPSISYYSKRIKQAGTALLSLINDILDISKVEAGKMELVEDEFELEELIEDAVNMVSTQLYDKCLNFKVEVDENLPRTLYGDRAHLRQILVNILTNAAKYTKRGSVSLKINGEINDETLILTADVKDSGSGIKASDLENIFAKFSRADLDKNINISGTGIGLNLSLNLAHMMGGEITVKSIYKVGSIFSFTVPLKVINASPIGHIDIQRFSEKEDSKSYDPSLKCKDTTILAVDDVENNLFVIQLLLKETGAVVETATSGAECINKCMKKKYDVILLDHMMPQMDGIDTYRSMKDIPDFINHDTPVIMLTANAIAGMKEKYMAEGFAAYLTKPVKGTQLESTIKKYLNPDKLTNA